ncbi:MAG: hypothetical protein KAW56_07345 [Candidatus Marinimicrobia bacterium]|nr:hypothetical protein [Candidatus Neomarinimicrobiota bacterium]
MCISKNKWKNFEPTAEYLSVVSGLTTMTKLHNYLKQFMPKAEKGLSDYWKTPWEFINNKEKPNDCEDFARLAVDVLVRIIGIDGARFIGHLGYDKSRWKGIKGHAICVFPYEGKLAVFSNNKLYAGLSSYEGAGHITFPDGLKYQEVRDWQGKILSKRRKWFGTF